MTWDKAGRSEATAQPLGSSRGGQSTRKRQKDSCARVCMDGIPARKAKPREVRPVLLSWHAATSPFHHPLLCIKLVAAPRLTVNCHRSSRWRLSLDTTVHAWVRKVGHSDKDRDSEVAISSLRNGQQPNRRYSGARYPHNNQKHKQQRSNNEATR